MPRTKNNNYGLFWLLCFCFISVALLTNLHKYTKQYGSLFHLKMGPFVHVLVCSDYNLMRFVLNDTELFKKPSILRFLKPWIGEGLAVVEGEKWKLHRKLIGPAFNLKILQEFIDIFESNCDRLVDELSKVDNTHNLDIHPYISRCTFNIICETAMGLRGQSENEILSYLQSIREMGRIFMTRVASPFKRFDKYFLFTQDYLIQQKWAKHLHFQTNRIIRAKRAENGRGRKVFLDILLEATDEGNTLSNDELRDEVNTFLFAGHDTTACATSFVLYCLSQHKSIQDEAFREQKQVFGDVQNANASYANLQEMKYLESVIKESMRLYAPVPVFGRTVASDLNYNGTPIPKGTEIFIFTHGLHMNPDYYPNPEKFDPTRFHCTDENQLLPYMPFGGGPRICIGQRYAILEIKTMVAKIIRNFELSPATSKEDMVLAAETVLRSLNGIKIGLKAR